MIAPIDVYKFKDLTGFLNLSRIYLIFYKLNAEIIEHSQVEKHISLIVVVIKLESMINYKL